MQSRKKFTLEPEFTDSDDTTLTLNELEEFLTEWKECNPELVSVTVELDDSCYIHS